MHSTRNGGWAPQLLSDDANQAGVYLIEESATAGLYKMKSNRNDIQYLNDWGPVFGNDKSNKNTGLSIFSFTPATEYTLAVPASGYTTLCLPFNVVLPEGVEAYDINNVEKQVLVSGEGLLQQLAVAGDIVQAGTPMIIKAAQGDHTFTITMDGEGAKTSLTGSVLRGSCVKKALTATGENKVLVLNGDVFEEDTQVSANACWVEAEIDDNFIELNPDFVEVDGWKFRYVPATNGIKLTDAAVSGNGVLVIPSSFNVEGENKNVVAISPDFLHNNTTVTSVTLPSTLVNLGFRELVPMFEGEYHGEPGDGATYNGNQLVGEAVGLNRCYEFPTDPTTGKPYVVDKEAAWKLTLDVAVDTTKNVSYNNWGSAIVSTKENSLDDYYQGYMQIYMHANRQNIVVKIDNADDRYKYNTKVLDGEGNETDEPLVMNSFKFELEHDGSGGYQVVVYYPNGKAKMYNISASENNNVKAFDRLYYSLPEGIHVKVKFEKLISQGLFVGCTNLTRIEVDPANPTFKSCEHGVLYDKNGYYVMRIPEGDPGTLVNGRSHFEIPSKVVKIYAGAVHGVNADIVLHSNPDIGKVKGHDEHVKNAKFYLSLDDIDATITEKETGYGGARDFISTNNNTYQSANYKRTPLAEGKYGTICLPFAANSEDAMKKYDFFKFKSGDQTSFTFSRVKALEANVPYLYKLKDKSVREEMKSETIEGKQYDVFESTGSFTVETQAKYDPTTEVAGTSRALGTYVNFYIETKNYAAKSAYYYFSTGQQKFLKVTEQLNYRPYRAIFVVNPEAGGASLAPARLSLRLLDDTTTDIDASLVEGMEAPEYYDLSGRRVLNPGSGVYIVNGKKVMIK